MKHLNLAMRGTAGALMSLLLLQSGCVFFRPRSAVVTTGCHEPPLRGELDNLPSLKAPTGLTALDTRHAIKVPEVKGDERVRSVREPCLDQPPSFADGITTQKPGGTTPPTPQVSPLQVTPSRGATEEPTKANESDRQVP